MVPLTISELAYNEFKQFLEVNKIPSNVLRIYLAGNGWSGPTFNIVLDEQTENDLMIPVNDLVFLIDGSLCREYGGFTLMCSKENGRDGFTIEPVIKPENISCSTCSSCN